VCVWGGGGLIEKDVIRKGDVDNARTLTTGVPQRCNKSKRHILCSALSLSLSLSLSAPPLPSLFPERKNLLLEGPEGERESISSGC
jgi:hypothetical protein